MFFSRYRLLNRQPILNFENLENFAYFSFASYILILNNYMTLTVLKGSLFLYARLCVTEKSPNFATYSERHNCMTC